MEIIQSSNSCEKMVFKSSTFTIEGDAICIYLFGLFFISSCGTFIYRFSTGRCNPNRGHIRYPSASRGSPRSGRNEATQRDPTDRAEQESARNLALTISPSRRNSPHEHLSNRQFIFYKPLPIKPVIYGGLATPFSLPSQSYGQNLWPSSHYSPRYLHLVSNSSSRYLSFNDLLVRAHFLNNK